MCVCVVFMCVRVFLFNGRVYDTALYCVSDSGDRARLYVD